MPGDQKFSHFDMFWIPAFAGMTIIGLLTSASNLNSYKILYLKTGL